MTVSDIPLIDRLWSVQIGTLLIKPGVRGEALDVEFSIEKSNKREPNTCQVKIYGLGRERRASLPDEAAVVIQGGYKDIIGTIFSGQSTLVDRGSRQGVEIITTIEATDSGEGYREAIVNRSWSGSVSTAEVLRYCLDAMAIGHGNLNANLSALTLGGGGTTYRNGTTVSGPARAVVDRIVRTAGLRWSTQDGVFQLRNGSRPANANAIRLAQETGLVGSPAKQYQKKRSGQVDPTKTKITAKALLNPGYYPGRLVVLESLEISGNFSVERCRHTGSAFGNDWHSDLVLTAY
jgi:hypothetical protein